MKKHRSEISINILLFSLFRQTQKKTHKLS